MSRRPVGERAPPHRLRHYACIHPETYKYFFDRRDVPDIWRRLAAAYGEVQTIAAFSVMEIRHERLILRATAGGNPITVIRTRRCEPADIAELHRLIGFTESAESAEQRDDRVLEAAPDLEPTHHRLLAE